MSLADLLLFLILGYIATLMIELPILCIGLSSRHTLSQKLISGLLLTALTYPIVVMVLPAALSSVGISSRSVYLGIAETFAPIAEILFFRYLIHQKLTARLDRDALVIAAANLASFLIGEAGLSYAVSRIVGWLPQRM